LGELVVENPVYFSTASPPDKARDDPPDKEKDAEDQDEQSRPDGMH
jgi:hypothetical protein